MTHGSLFSGIGGFDLAAEWVGWENVFHCEINEFGQKTLKYYWPNAISYADITKTDFSIHRGRIDVISGGFPCQPFSTAGKRKGTEDDRHLWPEMLRAIREIQPRYVVGENVRGLTNWNGGMVFDEVQADLETEGYEALPFLLPACAVNAPHRRDRIWFVAKNTNQNGRGGEQWKEKSNLGELRNVGSGDNERLPADNSKIGLPSNPDCNGRDKCNGNNEKHTSEGGEYAQCNIKQGLGDGHASYTKAIGHEQPRDSWDRGARPSDNNRPERLSGFGDVTDTSNERLQRGENIGSIGENGKDGNKQLSGLLPSDWENFPAQSPICGGNDGVSTRLDGITISKHRKESIKAYGNAIVPQVAYQIFKVINEMNEKIQKL